MSLRQAGKEILKANIGNALMELIPATYRGGHNLPQRGSFTPEVVGFGGDGVGTWFSYGGVGSCLKAYDKCPPLQAVCNKRALAFVNGNVSILNSNKKPSSSSQSKRFLKLIENPNPCQTRAVFLAQISIYLDLVGYCVIAPIKPTGYDLMSDAEQLWVIPPSMVEIGSLSNGLNFVTGGIDYVLVGGKRVDPSQVMIIQDINPSVFEMVKPGQRIKSLEVVINNIVGSYASESTLIKHRGPTGIISPKDDKKLGGVLPLHDDDKKRMQSAFNMAYGLEAGQSHIVLATASALEYQKTGFNFEELGLHKTIENGTKAICDTIGYPSELMGIINPTYNNKESADKEVYTKFIIPHSRNIAQQIGSYMLPITDELVFTYDHVPEMQMDKAKESTAKKTIIEAMKMAFDMDVVTLNQVLIELGYDPLLEGGDLRKSQIPPSNVPLAVTLGVGGVQALTAVLAATDISDDARQAALEIVFGLNPEDARRMSSTARVNSSQQNQSNATSQQQTN